MSESEHVAERTRRAGDRPPRDRALHSILVAMLVVSALVLVSGFVCILDGNTRIHTLAADASAYLCAKGITPDIENMGRCFVDRLEAYSKSLMEASTVSFLVAVLSAGVIAFAVSLINRGHEELRDMKAKIDKLSSEARQNVDSAGQEIEKLKERTKTAAESAERTERKAGTAIDRFFDSIVIHMEVSHFLAKAQQSSQELRRTEEERAFDSLVPSIRDLLTYVYRLLRFAKAKHVKLDPRRCLESHREVLDIRMDLAGVAEGFEQRVKDLTIRCDRIIQLLNQLFPEIARRGSCAGTTTRAN